jgi:hypothetical protein
VGDPALALEAGIEAVVFGGGASVHETRLRQAGYGGPLGRSPSSVAAAVGRIALARLLVGCTAGGDITPLYVRPSDAEVKHR